MINETEIREKFVKGYDCSQVVCSYFAKQFGMDEVTAKKVSACFGGGMQQGKTCGAYTGALMVIGLAYGHAQDENLLEQKEVMVKKTADFRERFLQAFSSDACKDLIGYDVSKPEELQAALDSGKLLEYCPSVVEKVIQIVEEILSE